MPEFTLKDLASKVNGQIIGDSTTTIRGAAKIDSASEGELTFLANPKYKPFLNQTRASAVIPAVPLYIALLYKVMKKKHLHEGCIQQMYRLYHDVLFTGKDPKMDSKGRIRMDDWEMRKDVQQTVSELMEIVETQNLDNIEALGDTKGMLEEYLRHHGFGMPGVDYSRDLAPNIF